MTTANKITLAKIDGELATFTTSRDALQQHAHKIAMMIFYHAAPKELTGDCNGTGDATRALKLVKAMPKSWAEQMTAWFRLFTPVRIVAKNDKCEYAPEYKKLSPADKKAKMADWWKVEEANSTPFYEATDEPDVAKLYTLEQILKMYTKLPETIEKKIADGKIAPEQAVAARAIVAAYEAVRVNITDIKALIETPEASNNNDKTETSADDNKEQAA